MKKIKIQPSLWTKPSCYACILNIGYLTLLKSINDNKKIQFEGINQIYKILKDFSEGVLPTEVSIKIFRMLQDLTRNQDPFAIEKKNSNELGKIVSSQIKLDIKKASPVIERLYKAVIASIVGNVIDYGTAKHDFKLDIEEFRKLYFQNLKIGFKIDHFKKFLSLLNQIQHILYIVDNAGELAFDKLLIEELLAIGKKVIVVLKEKPISNDATIEDAHQVGLDELPVKLITTGSNALGVMFNEVSDQFLKFLEKSDLIIAKGQSNWETLTYFKDRIQIPIIFILKVKCSPIADFLKVNVGDNIIQFA